MADALDIHPASDAERAEALGNLHDVWGRGLSAEEHLRWRLEYPKHRNATWYVGILGGRVVCGLGCYRLEFRVDGQIVPGFAFGEVHTPAEFRGRGFAPRLLTWVEEHQLAQGRILGMLYSDIDPGYYARLGYVQCPSAEGWTDPRRAAVEEHKPLRLVPFVAKDEVAAMARLYERQHEPLALSVARSPAYWEYLVSRDPGDEFYWAEEARGQHVGYVRLTCAARGIKVRDLALVDQDAARRRSLLCAVLRLGAERGVESVGGWVADTPLHRELFRVRPRRGEITMLKSLRATPALDPERLACADHFQEIDHV